MDYPAEQEHEQCPVEMEGGRVCGRQIYRGPLQVATPVCLMHSPDLNKSDIEFQEEFDRILREAKRECADFTRFVFPRATFTRREFTAKCVFSRAVFVSDADFLAATFTQDANFSQATFSGEAVFYKTKFTRNADFSNAEFAKASFWETTFALDANFSNTSFARGANFVDAYFAQKANFAVAKFAQEGSFARATFTELALFDAVRFEQADFSEARFAYLVSFQNTTFVEKADFGEAKFARDVSFYGATFSSPADFKSTTFFGAGFEDVVFKDEAYFHKASFGGNSTFFAANFAEDADFFGVKFTKDVDFRWATFRKDAYFNDSSLSGVVDFRDAQFEGSAEFRDSDFKYDASGLDASPALSLAGAKFAKPERATFYRTHLGQSLLHKCDVSTMKFSDVGWRRRVNGKRMLFEEVVDPRHEVADALQTGEGDSNPRNYQLIAELYQQLKKNYDDRRDYWTAGDFHYGEMEMKRLYSPYHHAVRRWLHSRLGLVAWYRYASEYGESYTRPIWWLLIVLLAFTLAYPGTGLCKKSTVTGDAHCDAKEFDLTYSQPLDGSAKGPSPSSARFALIGHSGMTSLYIAAFQRDLTYMPSYPLGRLLALIEVLITSTLSALFLLAVKGNLEGKSRSEGLQPGHSAQSRPRKSDGEADFLQKRRPVGSV